MTDEQAERRAVLLAAVSRAKPRKKPGPKVEEDNPAPVLSIGARRYRRQLELHQAANERARTRCHT